MTVESTGRVGKMPIVRFAGDGEPLELLVHLMSAGRLQVFDKRASLKDRASRILIRLADGRELRLREFGTKQRAWAKLLREGEVEKDEMVATLGPRGLAGAAAARARQGGRPATPPPPAAPRPARDRRDRPQLGRRDPLGGAALPVQEGLGARGRARSSASTTPSHVLGDAIDHYEEVIGDEVPNKMPMPLQVHKREGEPCPRCGTTIEAVFFSEHQTNYCPAEQTGGKVLKDRRLSRLLK